ncbi:hypothetical protein ACFYN3_35555 [Streptomyces lavendulae]
MFGNNDAEIARLRAQLDDRRGVIKDYPEGHPPGFCTRARPPR